MEAPYGFVEGRSQELPADVAAFCERRNLRAPLREALKLVHNCFDVAEEPLLTLGYDPDLPEDEWITIQIVVNGEVDDVVAAYRKYVKQWVLMASFDERSSFRLSYHIR